MKKTLYIIILSLILVNVNSVGFAQVGSYVLGPGDKIEISVWEDQSLTREVIVPPDRALSFPLIGEVDVTNMTTAELRDVLKKKIAEYIPNATVTVMILEFNSSNAFVIGKVIKPGQFPITMETTIMQILAMAGGLNAFASEGDLFILRQKNNGSVKIPFDYKQVIKGNNLEQNIILQRGDVIVVP